MGVYCWRGSDISPGCVKGLRDSELETRFCEIPVCIIVLEEGWVCNDYKLTSYRHVIFITVITIRVLDLPKKYGHQFQTLDVS